MMNIEFWSIYNNNIVPYTREFSHQTPLSTMTQASWYSHTEKLGIKWNLTQSKILPRTIPEKCMFIIKFLFHS